MQIDMTIAGQVGLALMAAAIGLLLLLSLALTLQLWRARYYASRNTESQVDRHAAYLVNGEGQDRCLAAGFGARVRRTPRMAQAPDFKPLKFAVLASATIMIGEGFTRDGNA